MSFESSEKKAEKITNEELLLLKSSLLKGVDEVLLGDIFDKPVATLFANFHQSNLATRELINKWYLSKGGVIDTSVVGYVAIYNELSYKKETLESLVDSSYADWDDSLFLSLIDDCLSVQ